MDRESGPRELWRRPMFRRFWVGESISFLGNQVTDLALPLTAVLLLGATAEQMGILTATWYLPYLVFGLPAGVWIDRMRRRPILVGLDLAAAAIVLVVPIAAWAGLLRSSSCTSSRSCSARPSSSSPSRTSRSSQRLSAGRISRPRTRRSSGNRPIRRRMRAGCALRRRSGASFVDAPARRAKRRRRGRESPDRRVSRRLLRRSAQQVRISQGARVVPAACADAGSAGGGGLGRGPGSLDDRPGRLARSEDRLPPVADR